MLYCSGLLEILLNQKHPLLDQQFHELQAERIKVLLSPGHNDLLPLDLLHLQLLDFEFHRRILNV